MRKIILIFLFSHYAFCEFLFPEAGARQQGLGNAFIGLSSGIYAIILNPAGLSKATSDRVSFSYTTSGDKYDFLGITLAQKMGGNCGLAVLSKKDKAFYFSYGRNLKVKNKAISGGASIKLFRAEKSGLGLDLGILYPLRNNLTIGFVFGNPLRDDFGYGFGLSARFKDLLFTGDIREEKKESLHFGVEKRMKDFFVRLGIDDKRLSIGFSRCISGIDIDFSISPLTLSFEFEY